MTTQVPALQQVQDGLAALAPRIDDLSTVPSKRFIATAKLALAMNPDIATKCSRASVYAACMKAASDGLILDGREAALVKFGGEAQYMPMTEGIIKRARNSGELSTLSAYVVYANDEYSYELGDNEHITHKPTLTGDRGKAVAAYAIAKLKDGGIVREWMTFEEIEEVRAVSKSGTSGPWKKWWSEMARKTVIRRLSKRLPTSSELANIITSVDADYDFKPEATPPAAAEEKASPLDHVEATLVEEEPDTEEKPPPHEDGDIV